MKYCLHCGKELTDDARFCVVCGTEAPLPLNEIAEEKQVLDRLHRFLRYERVAWLIGGLALLGELFLAVITEVPGSATSLFLAFVVLGLFLSPVIITNLVMAKKTREYIDELYAYARPTVIRCGSAGIIVLGVFFNTVAMIFAIINFATVKSNEALLERVIKRQLTPTQPQTTDTV